MKKAMKLFAVLFTALFVLLGCAKEESTAFELKNGPHTSTITYYYKGDVVTKQSAETKYVISELPISEDEAMEQLKEENEEYTKIKGITATLESKDGVIGLKDFPGEIIRLFQEAGFIYHSKVTIYKDPLVEATRTKALGLLHKQLCKDSSLCRNGLPDYIVTFRKDGENPERIEHPEGLVRFYGENEPEGIKGDRPEPDPEKVKNKEKYNELPVYSHQVWRRYANPVWMDIRQTNTLNRTKARSEEDERHICPLQLDVIARCIELWTNPNDIVLDPFMGIGSTQYMALEMDRRSLGIELKEAYFNQAKLNLETLEEEKAKIKLEQSSLFEGMDSKIYE